MRVIPVLDLKAGQAVLAIAGNRAHYDPVRGILHEGSDPIGLARAFRDRLGLSDLYLADLDAITGAPPALPLYGDLQRLGLNLWVDAGVRFEADVPPLLAAGASVVVLGLETLDGPEALAEVVDRHGPNRLVFSLDLRDGRPLIDTALAWGTSDPRRLVDAVVATGVRRVLLLDLARVGTGQGVGTLTLLAELRTGHSALEWIVGGGVRGPNDLAALSRAGASAVLVGSALHDGRIAPGRGLAPRAQAEQGAGGLDRDSWEGPDHPS